MIKELTMYTVICDNCLVDSNEGSEHSCWSDESSAEYMAEENGWVKRDGKHYCGDCIVYDDNDEEVINTSRTQNHIADVGK